MGEHLNPPNPGEGEASLDTPTKIDPGRPRAAAEDVAADADAAAAEIDDELPSKIGPYDILDVIAEGGMGVVYRARQASMHRPCALKVVSSMQIDDETVERFVAEARLAARVGSHPNLVNVYDAGTTTNGRAWLAMELVEGTNLAEWIEAGGDPLEAANLLAEVCSALVHVHAQGIVHRDIKPANILIDADGVPKLSDFGIAKALRGDGSLTTTGSFLGTPGYLAPEQAEDPRNADARADIYGLGAVLYAVLTGRAPYTGPSAITILATMLDGPPPRPSEVAEDVDPRLEAVCVRALERQPSDRYPDAVAFKAALEAACAEDPAEARGPAPSKHSSGRLKVPKRRARTSRRPSGRRRPIGAGSASNRKAVGRSSSSARILRRRASSNQWSASPREDDEFENLVPMFAVLGLLCLIALGLFVLKLGFSSP